MLTVEKVQKGQAILVLLKGTIDENANFDQLLGSSTHEMEINCKEVARINSVGVKAWIKYFHKCQSSGTKLVFSECSTAIVEQVNLISNFTCGGTIDSIFAPFTCSNCKSELTGLFKTKDLKKMQPNIPELNCPNCDRKAVFDDIPEEYFSFLTR